MLVSEQLAGKTLATAYGDAIFNEKGESTSLKPEHEKELAHITCITVVEEKKEAPAKKAPAKKAAAKEKE